MGMDRMIESFGDQVAEGWALGQRIEVPGAHSRINVIGMGGSALPGEFLASFAGDITVNLHRDYGYSGRLGDGLNICISYSGNTEETLDAFSEIVREGRPCIAISSGGKLIGLAKRDNIPYVQVRNDLVPRLALPLLSSVLLSICSRLNMVNLSDGEANYIAGKINASETRRIAEPIAGHLKGKIPLFYASSRNAVLATVGKIAVNENSKTQAFCNVFPELNHNEMNGFEVMNGSFAAVMIMDSEDHERNIRRMALTKKMLEGKSIPVYGLQLPAGPRLYKLISGVQSLYWLSYMLAGMYGVDAVNVPAVEQFKNEL